MASERDAVKIALAANGLIAAMKLVGAVLSGSASMLAEFKHSLADWANGFFLLIGINQSGKKADERFHFGHGKKAFFWAFIASLGMLFVGGASSIQSGINKIIHPETLEHISINLLILFLSIAFEGYSMYKAIQTIVLEAGEEFNGITSVTKVFPLLSAAVPSAKFIFFEDSVALIGLFVAFLAILISDLSGKTIFDGIASVIIGLLLLAVGLISAKENMDRILGESADPKLMLKVGNFTRSLPGVKDLNEIKSMIIGPDKFLFYILIEADPEIRLKNLDDLEMQVKKALQEEFNELEFIHISAIADNFIADWKLQAQRLK